MAGQTSQKDPLTELVEEIGQGLGDLLKSLPWWGKLVLALAGAAGVAYLFVHYQAVFVQHQEIQLKAWWHQWWLLHHPIILAVLVALVLLGAGYLAWLWRWPLYRVFMWARFGPQPVICSDATRLDRWRDSSGRSQRATRKIGTVRLSLKSLRHNVRAMGAIGSGKTEVMIQLFLGFVSRPRRPRLQLRSQGRWHPRLFMKDLSLAGVYFDPKDGVAIRKILQRLPEKAKDRLVLIRPWDKERAVGINLLEVKPGDDLDQIARQAVEILRKAMKDQSGVWGPRMEDAVRCGILTLAKNEDTTICDLPALLGDKSKRREWTKGIDDPWGLEPYWKQYELLAEKGDVPGVTPLLARLSAILLNESVRAMFGQAESTVDLEELLNHRHGILLLDIAKGEIGEDYSQLIGSLMVCRLWQVIQRRRRMPEKARIANSIFVCLDEFQNFIPRSRDLETWLTEGRGYGAGLMLGHQDESQIRDPALQAIARVNCKTQLEMHGKTKRVIRAETILAESRREQFYVSVKRRKDPRPVHGRTRRLAEWGGITKAQRERAMTAHEHMMAAASLEAWGTPLEDVEEALRRRIPGYRGPQPTAIIDQDERQPAQQQR
jgi:hypothetical protein